MRRVLLLGGGHSHLVAGPLLAGAAGQDVALALVAPSRQLLYSGMMPGWLAGQYRFDDCAIDLAAVCARLGIEWIDDRILDIDFASRVAIGARGRHRFDLASVNVGADNDPGEADPGRAGAAALDVPVVIAAKPFAAFVAGWNDWWARSQETPGARVLVVAGGGAAAVEIGFALAALGRGPGPLAGSSVQLVAAGERLLPGMSAAAAALARHSLQARGVRVRFGARYRGVGAGGMRLDDGDRIAADLVIVATGARPPEWLQRAASRDGVSLTPEGGVAVRADLRSISHPVIFAAGDCAGFVDRAVPRSGVHALRQGPVLAANLAAVLAQRSGLSTPASLPARYAPRPWTLALLNRCDGSAIGAWGPVGFAGRWAWRWKDRIDRRFIARFHGPALAGR